MCSLYPRDLSTWTLDIGAQMREDDHSLLERGRGNSCSVEFNVLYRLHPSMSEDDVEYVSKSNSSRLPIRNSWAESHILIRP